jgi:hypothetical protein
MKVKVIKMKNIKINYTTAGVEWSWELRKKKCLIVSEMCSGCNFTFKKHLANKALGFAVIKVSINYEREERQIIKFGADTVAR